MESKDQQMIDIRSQYYNADKIPKTEKGQRMRQKIIDAAKREFSRNSYFATRTSDITREAGISQGNFYRYFDNKEDVLRIIITDVLLALYESGKYSFNRGNLYENIEQSVKNNLNFYKENSEVFKILYEVINFEKEFYHLWNDLRKSFVIRTRKELEQIDLPEEIDKDYAASALTSMVARFAYIWCVLDGEYMEKDFNIDKAAKTVAKLWYKSIS